MSEVEKLVLSEAEGHIAYVFERLASYKPPVEKKEVPKKAAVSTAKKED